MSIDLEFRGKGLGVRVRLLVGLGGIDEHAAVIVLWQREGVQRGEALYPQLLVLDCIVAPEGRRLNGDGACNLFNTKSKHQFVAFRAHFLGFGVWGLVCLVTNGS